MWIGKCRIEVKTDGARGDERLEVDLDYPPRQAMPTVRTCREHAVHPASAPPPALEAPP